MIGLFQFKLGLSNSEESRDTMFLTCRWLFITDQILAVGLTAGFADCASAQQKKPNIVFILTDNLGYGEIGCYGGGITRGAATPRIGSLAKEGLRLLNMNMETQCTPITCQSD